MRLPFFIARRYLFTKHSLNFITIISGISIIGIMLGVAALIIVVSIFNGFRALVESYLVGFDPHVRVSAVNSTWIRNADSLRNLIATVPLVKAVSPVLAGKVVGVQKNTLQAFSLQGVKSGEFSTVSGVEKRMVAGKFALVNKNGIPQIVLGIGLADKLRATRGDTISLVAPSAIETAISQSALPPACKVIVSGIFQSNNKDYDSFQGYVALETAQKLFNAPQNAALFIDIRGTSSDDAETIRTSLEKQFQSGFRIETWYDLHHDLYNVMRFERMSAFIVLTLIILVAAFNVFASLTMTVAEKRPDIGILKAIGAKPSLIKRIFFVESLLVGMFGTISGAGLGLFFCWGQMTFGWLSLDTTMYIVPAIPLSLKAEDVVAICVVSLVLSLLAGIYPAKKAANVRTARALIIDERVS